MTPTSPAVKGAGNEMNNEGLQSDNPGVGAINKVRSVVLHSADWQLQ